MRIKKNATPGQRLKSVDVRCWSVTLDALYSRGRIQDKDLPRLHEKLHPMPALVKNINPSTKSV